MLAPSTSSDPLKPKASSQPGLAGGPVQGAENKGGVSRALFNQIGAAAGALNEPLEKAFEQFWGQPITVRLVSVSTRSLYFWRYDNFYVSQASSDIHLRMSDTGCSTLLTASLGGKEPPQPFSFSTLTGFEASLLTTFSRESLTILAKNLILPKALTADKEKSSPDTPIIHLVWAFLPSEKQDEPLESGKLILSLPLTALKPDVTQAKELPPQAWVQLSWLYHALAPVEIAIGSGQIPIGALEQLEPDDIVLLENSGLDQLFIINPLTHGQTPFPARLTRPERLPRPALDGSEMSPAMTQDMYDMTDAQGSRQALLDNLLIEVGAQFTPAKMPLHQIKQMSEGLVVEIGDLAQNEVLLTVEGKPLALGELVIVGDKFGVRIVSLTPDGETLPVRPIRSYPVPVPDAMRQEKPVAQQQALPQQEVQAPAQEPPQEQYQAPPQPAQPQELNDDFLDDDFGDDDDDW